MKIFVIAMVVTVVLLGMNMQPVEMTMVSSILPGTQDITVMEAGAQTVTKECILVVEMSGGITTEWEPCKAWTILQLMTNGLSILVLPWCHNM